MKLIEFTRGHYRFETSNGGTWTRQHLVWAKKSVEIRGWQDARDLFLPDDSDKILFPDATHRIQLSGRHTQDNPLFTSVPCRIKPGTKNVLQMYDGDNIVTEVRIKTHFNWE
jgi:hypothetical protein